MDFLDPKKKRANKIKLYIGYVLMAVVLGISTTVLVFAAYGYGIDRNTGEVIQNGLLIVDAHPESAKIYVNGEYKGTSDSRLVLPAGKYKVELQRDNYRSWTHDLNLEGSSIEQLVYPLLIPTKLVTKPITTYALAPTMATESPDRHWLIIHQPNTAGSFEVVNLNDNKNPKTVISLPPDSLTVADGIHSFESVEWSTNNTHVLLKHIFTGGSEFVMLDRETPANSININKVFLNIPFSRITLIDKKPDKLMLHNLTDGLLYKADTKTNVATVILPSVINYKTYQDKTVLYVTKKDADLDKVEVRILVDQKDYLLSTLPISENYLLDLAQFDGKLYLVCGASVDGSIFLYKDPITILSKDLLIKPLPFRVLKQTGAQNVSFSAIARFVAVQGGSNFLVYDLETSRQFRYDTKMTLLPNQKASWMDGHRLTLNSEGFVNIFDFDGTNQQKLIANLPGMMPFFDRDYTAMFTISTEAEKTSLNRTELKVLPAGQPN